MAWEIWLQGLLAAVISAFASAASGAIGLPTVFTFDRNGLINMIKLATVPALIAFFTYLKQNPTPTLKATVDPQGNVTVKGNPVAEVTVEGKKEL
jgi:acyl-coenzyme A synthetase/AMP-(fatty) acid ligase